MIAHGAGHPRWVLRRANAEEHRIDGYPPIVGTVLAARGIVKREQANPFYRPHDAEPHDPMQLPDILPALERVQAAIAAKQTIALFGDFDVDGVTSLAVLKLGLGRLGAQVITYIPERFSEGYGLNNGASDHLHRQGARLVITADCGTSSVGEVAHANALGMDVIIIDHHTVPPDRPAALALINPKRTDSTYPFAEMAAVGVSYRFVQALSTVLNRPVDDEDFIDLVALGTVADVAPLFDENRRIVTDGLARMARGLRPGLEALAAVAGVKPENITASTFGFAFGPRMNAAGRLEHANIALDLMLAENFLQARPLAERLEALNQQRRQQCDDAFAEAEELVGAADDPLIMVGSERMHAGIVGIVAARLAEQHHRPAIVYEYGPETSRASARTIPAFDIIGAIRKEASLLVKHGGHRAAAGFTIANGNITEFRERLINTAAELLDDADLRPSIEIDAEIDLADLRGLEIKGLTRFEPCGEGNPRPVLLSRRVQVREWRPVGATGDHLKLRLKQGAATWPAIAFRRGQDLECSEVDVVYTLARDWRGNGVELEVLDLAPSMEGRPLESPE